MNKNHWFPAATLIIGWPDETPDETQYTIDLLSDFRKMDFRGLVAPLLYQDFGEKNSMHFGNLNEAQFTLYWKCWENNLRVINDIIPIILRNKSIVNCSGDNFIPIIPSLRDGFRYLALNKLPVIYCWCGGQGNRTPRRQLVKLPDGSLRPPQNKKGK